MKFWNVATQVSAVVGVVFPDESAVITVLLSEPRLFPVWSVTVAGEVPGLVTTSSQRAKLSLLGTNTSRDTVRPSIVWVLNRSWRLEQVGSSDGEPFLL